MQTQQESNAELRKACDTLALALEDASSGVLGMLTNLIPNVLNAFTHSTELEKLPKYEGVGQEHHAFLEKMEKHSYAETRFLRAYRPAGLISPYVAYLPILEKAVDHVLAFTPNILNPYVQHLALIMSHKDAALSLDDHKLTNGAIASTRNAIESEVLSVFTANSQKTDSTVGDMTERNKDWIEIFKLIKRIDDKIKSVNLKLIDQKIKQAQDYLNSIHDLASKQDSRLQNATPEVLISLSEGAYQVALELEFVAITYYRCLTTSQAIKDTEASLMKALS